MNESFIEQLHNAQQENEQLKAQIENLQQLLSETLLEQDRLKHENQNLKQELINVVALSPPDYEATRSRILKSLTQGRGKIATTSPQYKTAARVLDRFIDELQKSTPTKEQ